MNVKTQEPQINTDRIMIKCSRSIEFIEVRQIIRIEALRSYSKIYIQDGDPLVLSFPLKKIEDKLEVYSYFFRSHKSHIVNLLHTKSYHSDKGIKLNDGSCIPLAIHLKPAFLDKVEIIFGCNKKKDSQISAPKS
ncbi:MAG: hypothetical protein C0397_15020 [Odoribacter sp.]|nr:hypothetical protein [Odoribacter sp.]